MFLVKKENSNEEKIIDNLRALSIDMLNKSGFSGIDISLNMAPTFYTLYSKHLRINPADAKWVNRDRFILSCNHASDLFYATLYMSGYNISLDDLKKFGNINSKTPIYPEIDVEDGVDISTGLAGVNIASGVGIAIGESYLRNYYQNLNHKMIDFYTYILCDYSDLMEGISYEAISFAGALKLNKLIILCDATRSYSDVKISNNFGINIQQYFSSLNWNVLSADSSDVSSIDSAINKAHEANLPSAIIINTTTQKYSNVDTNGNDLLLNDDIISDIKNNLNIRDIAFSVSNDAKEDMENMIKSRIDDEYNKWQKEFNGLDNNLKEQLNKLRNDDLSLDNTDIDYEITDINESLELSSYKILNCLAKNNPFFIGGSNMLEHSFLSKIEENNCIANQCGSRNFNYGSRENAMAAIQNGISLVGIKNFVASYLVFADYLKPALRLACQMNLANIYIFSNDSISIGKTGKIYQPVEQLIGLRSIPNLDVFRPADVNEMIGVYKMVASKKNGPTAIVLSKNPVKIKNSTSITEVKKGGYIVKHEEKYISAIIIASGEEVDLALEVAEGLVEKGYDIRVVSMVSIQLFKRQKQDYKDKILPLGVKTFVIEPSSSYSWHEFVYNDKYLITLDEFGVNGDKDEILKKFGFTKEKIEEKIINLLK